MNEISVPTVEDPLVQLVLCVANQEQGLLSSSMFAVLFPAAHGPMLRSRFNAVQTALENAQAAYDAALTTLSDVHLSEAIDAAESLAAFATRERSVA